METTQVSNTEGLETFGNSETISNIADFLSLDELGITDQVESDIELSEVEKEVKEEKKDEFVSLETLEPVEVDLGEDEDNTNIPSGLDYKAIVKDLVDNGIWDGIEAFETEDGPVPFDDMNIDKDTFVALMKHNQEELKSKLTESTVSTEGISEFTQKLISIEKHGGSVQQALRAYETIKQPLENIDISDPKGQRAVCYLRLQQQGIQGEEAKDLIETYELKGVLETKASQFKEQLDNAFNEWMEKKEAEAIEEDRAYRESLKNYRSSLSESLKAVKGFELSETHRRKLVDIATKEQEDGSFELDVLIDNHRRNPLDAADLVLFLTDKENFIEKKAKALLEEDRKKTLKTIGVIPVGKVAANLGPKKTETKGANFMPLDKLK